MAIPVFLKGIYIGHSQCSGSLAPTVWNYEDYVTTESWHYIIEARIITDNLSDEADLEDKGSLQEI